MDGERSFNLQDTLKFALLQILHDTATSANLSVNGYELGLWVGWQGHRHGAPGNQQGTQTPLLHGEQELPQRWQHSCQ